MDTLLFDRPANTWEEAIPLGNGFLGAMVYGKTDRELIEMNEDSLWSGSAMGRMNPMAYDHLDEIRRLLEEGRAEEAQKLTERTFFSLTPHPNHYQPLGQVWLRFWNQNQISCYGRQLRMDQAVMEISYDGGDGSYSREAFVSYPAQVFVYHLKAESGKRLNFDVYTTRRDTRPGKTVSYLDDIQCGENGIYLTGYNGNRQSGIGYAMGVDVKVTGGDVIRYAGRLAVENATEATVYVTGRTTFRSADPRQWCEAQLCQTMKKDYTCLRAEHIADYARYYKLVSLRLKGSEGCGNLTVPARLERVRKGGYDPELVSMYFNFGRYLLISSSRLGSLPANLQGIWNNEFDPSWGSKYTININLEMNYWMSEKTGLSELHLPLMELLKTMLPRGKEVAEKLYGAKGACAHHVTDMWGDCAPMDYNNASTVWPMGYVWLCLHILEHYWYTRDGEFLKEYFPVLEENARFLMSYMYLDQNGHYATGPSVSPENTYRTRDGQQASVCSSPAMDIQIVREFLSGYVEICRILERQMDGDNAAKWLENLSPDRIGAQGQVMEWQEDYEECEPGHRHVSQLFALYPGTGIRVHKTPELAEAAKVTLERRMKHGGGHTGWSCAWIAHFYARLQEGEQAYGMLQKLFAQSTLDNLLDNCPPFQIDGNFGGANAILEMMVQDYGDEVYLLPAMPQELGSGSLKGLRLKCGGTLDLEWEAGAVRRFQVTAIRSMDTDFQVNGKTYRVELPEQETYTMEVDLEF